MPLSSDERRRREQLAEALNEKERRQARHSLRAYIKQTMPFFVFNYHHDEIIEHLEMVEQGAIERLMITVPPRHGKSTISSIAFPSWFLGKNPTKDMIAASWGGDLTSGFGSQVRNRMRQPVHTAIFGEEGSLSSDTKARDLWKTNAGGTYRGAGVGGGITGFGAHCFLIDDPVKSREEADSKLIRDKTWAWYKTDCYTRQQKEGSIVVIQTRWHEDDLSGRLLEAELKSEGDKWVQVHFPAISEQGEALWPEFYPIERLEKFRRVMEAGEFESLYQGRPSPEDGNLFTKEYMRTFNRMPDITRMRIYGASDYAVTAEGGDYTVHMVVGVDEHDDLYVLDLWRKQSNSITWVESLLDLMQKWSPIMWAEESGQIKRALGPIIHKRQLERKVWCARREFSSTADKVSRCRAILARVEMGKVYFPEKAMWWGEMQAELLKFPHGRNDDIVDAFSLIGRLLDVMSTGTSRPRPADRQAIIRIGSDNLPPGMRQMTYGEIMEDTIMEQKRLINA